MEDKTLILLFTSLIPLFTALVGAIIEGISMQDSVTIREKHVKKILMYYFITFIFIGSGVSTGVALPETTIFILPLTVFALYMAPVLYYRFICILTDVDNNDNSSFNNHYLLPLLTSFCCCTLYYIVPSAVRLQLVIPVVQFILTGIYMLLAVRKLTNSYNHHINDPAWTKWFHLSIFLCSLSFIWSGAFLFTICLKTAIWALSIAITAAWIQAIYLCCNTFNRKSLLFLPLSIAPIPIKTPSHKQITKKGISVKCHKCLRWKQIGDTVEVEHILLTRKVFEKEVVGKKMYLRPQLRLTELAEALGIHRNYLSNFINTTYGCGFNEYINRLRLRELERLLSLPSNQGKSANKLYAKAGFLNYRNYLRTKKAVYGQNKD